MTGLSADASDAPRHLWVLRHAKASADAPSGGGDRERPLAGRGRRDATALGRTLATGKGPFATRAMRRPDVVVCSSAVRTTQTAALLIEASGASLPIDARHALYAADVDTVLDVVRGLDDTFRSVLLVGHNPTAYNTVFELLPDAGRERRAEGRSEIPSERAGRDALAAFGFPTCALAALSLTAERWADVQDGTARLWGLFKPPY